MRHWYHKALDYLRQFHELDAYTVEAADGHFIDHACHTEKGKGGKVHAAGFIYAMNLRNGLLKPLCCVTNGTRRNHEIPILRNYLEKKNSEEQAEAKCLYVYDKAVTDYAWWDRQMYYKCWTIEKAFNNSKSNLKEKKAWSSDFNALKNQMRLTAMTYNLMRVFEEPSKIQNPEMIHPSDKKYTQALEKRQQAAQKRGGFVNPLFFQARIVRISSFTIRAFQNAIIRGKSLAGFVKILADRLVSRSCQIGEH